MIAKETLYLAADRETVVKEGNPKAQSLLVREGQEIPDAVAEQYGIKGEKSSPGPAKAPAAEDSGSPAPQNREDAMPKRRTRAKAKR